jgi:hypothetical protein
LDEKPRTAGLLIQQNPIDNPVEAIATYSPYGYYAGLIAYPILRVQIDKK